MNYTSIQPEQMSQQELVSICGTLQTAINWKLPYALVTVNGEEKQVSVDDKPKYESLVQTQAGSISRHISPSLQKRGEFIVYTVNVQDYEFDTRPTDWDDDKFMSEAEIQGHVYTLSVFQKAFNCSQINSDTMYIRIIKQIKTH